MKSMTQILEELQRPYPQFVKMKAASKNGPANVPFLPWNAQRNILNAVLPGQWSLEYPVLTKVERVVFVQCRLNIQTTDGAVYFEGWGEKEQDLYDDGKPKPMYGDCTKQAQRAAFKAACSMLGIGDFIRAKSQNFTSDTPRPQQRQSTQQATQQARPVQADKPATQPALIAPLPQPAAKPAPLYVDKKEQHAAALAAQAPPAIAARIETGLERACPANCEPDEWDKRCSWVPRLLEVTARWPKAYERNWFIDQTKVSPFTSEELYHVEASELAKIYELAIANAVTREASMTEDELFRKECADAGFAGDAGRLIGRHTFKNETKYDLARKALEQLKQRVSKGKAT